MQRISLLAVLALAFSPAAAHADLGSLISSLDAKSSIGVIVPVSDRDFGLLVQSREEFSRKLALSEPLHLETPVFKLVENASDEALPIDDFDGANVLVHLLEARQRYQILGDTTGLRSPVLDRKTVVRVRVDAAYNLATHFAQQHTYNDDRYIPGHRSGRWGQEIWFHARKTVFNTHRLHELAQSAGLSGFAHDWLGLGVLLPLQLYQRTDTGMDGAKIPSAIYHEAFHWATDAEGFFPMAAEGNPVAEDYARYFSSSLQGRASSEDVGEFTSRLYRRDYSKIRPIRNTEPTNYNASAFGPSVFWQIRRSLGAERADRLLWSSMRYLHGDFRETEVPVAVLAAARQDQELTSVEIRKIADLFRENAQSYVNLERKTGYAGPAPSPRAREDLRTRISGLSNEALAEAAVRETQGIRQLPEELGEEGVTLTPEEATGFSKIADSLQAEAHKPGFSAKVTHVLGRIGRGFEKAGLGAAKGLGLIGSGVYAALAAPLVFGTDFTATVIHGPGHEVIARSSLAHPGIAEELEGGAGGLASYYFAFVGLNAVGYATAAPFLSTSLGAIIANLVVCRHVSLAPEHLQEAEPFTEREQYCRANAKLMSAITGNIARAGARAGGKIHSVFKKPTH